MVYIADIYSKSKPTIARRSHNGVDAFRKLRRDGGGVKGKGGGCDPLQTSGYISARVARLRAELLIPIWAKTYPHSVGLPPLPSLRPVADASTAVMASITAYPK